MGQSTDAILIYGVDFGEDPPWEPFDEGETDEAFEAAKKANPLGWLAWNGPSADDPDITIESHCSGQSEMYIVGISESELRANRGYPKQVKSIDTRPQWDALLTAFFEKHGLVPPASPAWLLASWWS